HSFRIFVQPSHRKQSPGRLSDEVEHRALSPVLRGRDDSLRLMEHEIRIFFIMTVLSVHSHFRCVGVYLCLRCLFHRTFDLAPSLSQVRFCLAAAQPRRLCQKLIPAHLFHRVLLYSSRLFPMPTSFRRPFPFYFVSHFFPAPASSRHLFVFRSV